MDWLDEHMRKHLAETPGESNVLTLRPQPSLIEEVGARTVELVERAIQHIQNVEEEAAATHARAETLARNALERLKLGEERVRAAESARQAAEARIEGATAKLRDMEIQLERTVTMLPLSRSEPETRRGELLTRKTHSSELRR